MTDRPAVVFLGRVPVPPDEFVRTAYRLLGHDAHASHSGKASASFAYRVADGAVLVAWGDLLPACSRPGLPVRFVPVPEVVPGRAGKVKVSIRHLTPTLLKRQGVPWWRGSTRRRTCGRWRECWELRGWSLRRRRQCAKSSSHV